MSVSNLDNQEKGMSLNNREPRGSKKAQDDIERFKKGEASAEAELQGLRERIAAAKEITTPAPVHCSDCAQAFANGRDAAIKVIEGA